ncbi:uncharacterized protein TNCV_2941191 [Trichonephila clavipes]|nr:uncharacterized protein TNCV_2941191 [Trichonephila clavipes]
MVKECIGRQYDSIDKRFCFDVIPEDKPTSYTFQALSEEDRRLWLDAMDGKEPLCKNYKQLITLILNFNGIDLNQNLWGYIESETVTKAHIS